MKIILITLSTPTKENLKAASALPYHLIKQRNKSDEIIVYSFNINHVDSTRIEVSEKGLGVKINIINLSFLYKLLIKRSFFFIRLFLPFPIFRYLKLNRKTKKEIISWNPDVMWIYGEELSFLANSFSGYKCIITTPDCEAMYYYRLLAKRFSYVNVYRFMQYTIAYYKYIKLARNFPVGKDIRYHLVGMCDRDFLQEIVPTIDAHFVRHPHYSISDAKKIAFNNDKIRLLIAGRNDIYMQEASEKALNKICESQELIAHYEITFLGKNWEHNVAQLRDKGFDVKQVGYVEDYIKEIIKYDIQLTPISVGTGTKGKVLDALANGLLVIGNKYALENISVKSGCSCIEYDTVEELIHVLNDIPGNKEWYEQIAATGRECVRKFHGSSMIAEQFYSLFK